MKSIEDLRGHNPVGEFTHLARLLMLERGNRANALARAEAGRAPERVVAVLRDAVSAGGGASWAGELVNFRLMSNAFADTLRTSSVFYAMLSGMVRLPFETQIGRVLTGIDAGVVGPGQGIPVRAMHFGGLVQLDRLKAAAIVAMSRELLEASAAAESLISRSLRAGVAQAVDVQFLSILLAGVVPTPSSGAPLSDLRTLLAAVDPTEESRPYWLAARDVGRALATAGATTGSPGITGGGPVFPGVAPAGAGTLLNLPLLISSAVPAGQLLLVDASGIGAASDPLELDASQQVALEMDDAPAQAVHGTGSPDTGPTAATGMVSLWQTNSAALRAIAYFGAVVLRPGSVAAVEGITW